MRFRKLRIAWSVTCGIACVLLIVLWVRSYTRRDRWETPANSTTVSVESTLGRVSVFHAPGDGTWTWHKSTEPDDTYLFGAEKEQAWHTGFAGFAVYTTFGHRTFRVPHWFFVLVSALAAAAPWIRWRFSLRTLLVAATLVAVVLGLVAYAARK
jgi:hypothetical protein